jgi:hypothetical protein
MISSIETIVLIGSAIVVAILVYTLIRMQKNDFSMLADHMARRSRQGFEVLKPCPLCETLLRKGETVHTHVFSGSRTGKLGPGEVRDSIAHVFGCPYCYPSSKTHPRICPVCRSSLGAEDFVIARFFERTDKRHVHVLGCTRCRDARRSRRSLTRSRSGDAGAGA